MLRYCIEWASSFESWLTDDPYRGVGPGTGTGMANETRVAFVADLNRQELEELYERYVYHIEAQGDFLHRDQHELEREMISLLKRLPNLQELSLEAADTQPTIPPDQLITLSHLTGIGRETSCERTAYGGVYRLNSFARCIMRILLDGQVKARTFKSYPSNIGSQTVKRYVPLFAQRVEILKSSDLHKSVVSGNVQIALRMLKAKTPFHVQYVLREWCKYANEFEFQSFACEVFFIDAIEHPHWSWSIWLAQRLKKLVPMDKRIWQNVRRIVVYVSGIPLVECIRANSGLREMEFYVNGGKKLDEELPRAIADHPDCPNNHSCYTNMVSLEEEWNAYAQTNDVWHSIYTDSEESEDDSEDN